MRWWLVLPAIVAVASCDEPGVHILTAQLYDAANACLGPSDSIDVVNGQSTGDNCDPQCLSITVGDATSVYMTTVCPSYPGDYTVEGRDTAFEAGDPCIGAFAVYDSDAGVCPPVAADAGEAGDDGGGESGAGDDGGGSAGDAADDGATTD